MFEKILIPAITSGTADPAMWQTHELSYSSEDVIPEAEIVDLVASEELQSVQLSGRTLRVINGQLFFVDRGSPSIPTP